MNNKTSYSLIYYKYREIVYLQWFKRRDEKFQFSPNYLQYTTDHPGSRSIFQGIFHFRGLPLIAMFQDAGDV